MSEPVKLLPGGRDHFRSVPYTPETIETWKREAVQHLYKTLSNLEPTVREIIVHNNTRTASVTINVTGGVMYIIVTNEEQDSIFRFE